MPIITLEDTLACLAVEAIGENRFTGPNIAMPYSRIFGGQLLAQAIAVAAATAEDKRVKSIHVAFPRAGDLGKPVEYEVERIQDGRSLALRGIRGSQEGVVILSASVSLHVEEPGPSHQIDAPSVGGPETATGVDLSMIPWETRAVGGVDLDSRDRGPSSYALWMRAPALGDDPIVHQGLLAHSTDLTLIGTCLRPHPGLGEADSPERVQTAVTTHALWFHRPLRVDDWLLLSQESPSTAGARGFGWGHVFNRSGDLVASFAQESLIRPV